MTKKIEFSAKFKRNYVAFFAVLLFFLIIAGEIALAVSIPAYMNRTGAMAEQVNKLDFLQLFDTTRRTCDKISGTDETLLLEKQLLANSLDQLALYLRREADLLTPEEISRLNAAIVPLYGVATKLRNGKRFSGENRLNTAVYIDKLLKKNAGESTNAGK